MYGVSVRHASLSGRQLFATGARRLGFEPLFVCLLLALVPLGAGGALLAGAAASPPRRSAFAPVAPPLPTAQARPPLEVSWIMPITIRDHHAIGGVQHLEVGQGDEVTVELKTNDAITAAIPGYEIWARVNPGDFAMLELTAFDWGTFRVEADGELVGVLSVRPSWAGPAK
jgi:hypothetical protein